jgi:excisionase family DNA binding protein
MMNIKEVSKYFHVSAQTVRAWVRDGELKCFQLGHVSRFSDAQIQQFIEANEGQRVARG